MKIWVYAVVAYLLSLSVQAETYSIAADAVSFPEQTEGAEIAACIVFLTVFLVGILILVFYRFRDRGDGDKQ